MFPALQIGGGQVANVQGADAHVSDRVSGERDLARLSRIRRVHPHVRTALTALLVSAAYYLGGVVGIGLMFPDSPIAIIWPSNAILLAALLLTPVRTWWVYLLAVAPTHQNLVANFQPDVPLLTMLGQIVGNVSQASISALAVRRFVGAPHRFDTLASLTTFILLAAIAVPCVAAALVAYVFLLTGWVSDFWIAWRLRFLANVFATLTITPLIVLTITGGMTAIRRAPLRRYAEFGLLTLGLLAVGIPGLWPGRRESAEVRGAAVYAAAVPVVGSRPVRAWRVVSVSPDSRVSVPLKRDCRTRALHLTVTG